MQIEISGIERPVGPGDTICKAGQGLSPGDGVYVAKGFLTVSRRGKVETTKLESGETQVAVFGEQRAHNSLQIGDKVLARVENLKQDNVFVKIIAVGSNPLLVPLEGVIKRKDIREKAVDLLNIEECFVPGDIVQAKVGSFGDSKKIQLITSEEDLGVIFARGDFSGEIMMPISYEEMACPKTKARERRKVAKPDLSLFKVK